MTADVSFVAGFAAGGFSRGFIDRTMREWM